MEREIAELEVRTTNSEVGRRSDGVRTVEPILRFMENHPDVDYGTPGPLVHFVETFPNYEEKLIGSVERQPTPNTLGMFNRAFNSKRNDAQEWRSVIAVLERVLENHAADALTRSRARYTNLTFRCVTRPGLKASRPNAYPHAIGADQAATG